MTECIRCGANQTHRVCDSCFRADFNKHCMRDTCSEMASHPASLCEWLDRNPEHRRKK